MDNVFLKITQKPKCYALKYFSSREQPMGNWMTLYQQCGGDFPFEQTLTSGLLHMQCAVSDRTETGQMWIDDPCVNAGMVPWGAEPQQQQQMAVVWRCVVRGLRCEAQSRHCLLTLSTHGRRGSGVDQKLHQRTWLQGRASSERACFHGVGADLLL